MTERQAALIGYLQKYLHDNGHGPTYQQIADALGYASRSTAYVRISDLEDAGYVRRVKRKGQRGVVVVTGSVCPTCKQAITA